MQFDILNELLTSTVSDLFNSSTLATFESKNKVKELEGLIKQQNTSKRSSQISLNESTYSMGSQSNVRTEPLKRYNTVEEWMNEEAPRRLQESIKRIGVKEALLKSNRRADLEQFIDAMKLETLATEKKKVKNQLRCYDNDFKTLFNRLPNHHEKQPFRPLYVYYKKVKQYLDKKGGQEMSQQKIEAEIARIKEERKELRIKIEAYQKEFEANNNRRIRYVRDIQPIEGEYKRYKDLKNDLQKFEEMLKNN